MIDGGEYSLDPSYRALSAPAGKYSVESMMPGQYIYQNITGRLRNPYVEWQGIPTPDGRYGSAGLVPAANIVNAYETGDTRKTASIFFKGDKIDGLSDAITWSDGFLYANKKVLWDYTTWPNKDFFSQELNMPFMRYAEILLTYAEASNELNDPSEALAKLELVRKRARGNKTFAQSVVDGDNAGAGVLPQITTTDKTALREIIWNERRIELAFEPSLV